MVGRVGLGKDMNTAHASGCISDAKHGHVDVGDWNCCKINHLEAVLTN